MLGTNLHMLPAKAVKIVNMKHPMFEKDRHELWLLYRHYGIGLLAPLPRHLYKVSAYYRSFRNVHGSLCYYIHSVTLVSSSFPRVSFDFVTNLLMDIFNITSRMS